MTGSARWLLLASYVSWASLALAEEPAAISPPVVQSSTEVAYPPGARGDAHVVLDVLVDAEGHVTDTEVVEGAEPFIEPVRAAVSGWHFEPARRGDVAVAARIRARIEFHAPPPEAPPPPEHAALEPPKLTAPVPAKEEPQAVLVQGTRREHGVTTLSAEEVKQLPGAFGDAFRAVEALPGVTPLLSGFPYFFVRGAPPNNNGYFFDGIRVPLLFHVALGPSVIHPGLLERVDFYPGAAPASFGGVAGAVVSGRSNEPRATPHGEANLRLVDAGALVELPFAGGRGSALVAGRYGYPGPILSALSNVRLNYWDYQSRLAYRVSERDTLSLLAFGSHDYLGHRDIHDSLEEDIVADFHRLDLRYDHAFESGRLRVGTTLGYDSQGSNPIYLHNRSAALRLELDQRISPAVLLRTGAEARLDDYSLRRDAPTNPEEAPVPSNADPPPRNLYAAVRGDAVLRLTPRVELAPGVRVAVFDTSRRRSTDDATRVRTTRPAVDPRVSARLGLTSWLTFVSQLGLAHQYPSLRIGELPATMVTGSGFPAGNSRLQTSLQASQGLELALPWALQFTATGFFSRSWGLTDLTAECIQIEPASAPSGQGPRPSDPVYCPSNAPVRGHAYGLEVLLRRRLAERLGGFISYTLSRSVRQSHFLLPDGSEEVVTVPSEFDRTHVMNAVLSYDLGRGWRSGARFVVYSGAPYSPMSGNLPVAPYNSLRAPAFYRLDVRLEKRWRLGPESSIAFVIEGQNVTLREEPNTLGLDCRGEMTPEMYTTQCRHGKIGPITIPSLGVEAIF